jgi:tetratricopeptide (TPR) repeat protein
MYKSETISETFTKMCNEKTNEAVLLMVEADKILNSWSIFNFTTKKDKYKQALELYKRSGSIFKMQNAIDKSIEAYEHALELSIKLESNYETTQLYIELALLVRTNNISLCVKYYINAINLTMTENKMYQVARLWNDVGNSLEKYGENTSLQQIDDAIDAYKKSAELFELDMKHMSSIKALKNAIKLCLSRNKYHDVVILLDKLILLCILSDIQQYSIKKYISMIIICSIMCEDYSKTYDKLNKYCVSMDRIKFGDSPEYEYLAKLIDYCNYDNKTELVNLINEQNKPFSSDSDILGILVKVKDKYVWSVSETHNIMNNNLYSPSYSCIYNNDDDDFT